MTLPKIRILSGPNPFHEGLADVSLSGQTSIFSAFSEAVDYYQHSDEELQDFLTFRYGIARQAKVRSRWLLGRLYNRFAGEDPDYVELSGTHLIQTLATAGHEVPKIITGSGKYKLRSDVVAEALQVLKARR